MAKKYSTAANQEKNIKHSPHATRLLTSFDEKQWTSIVIQKLNVATAINTPNWDRTKHKQALDNIYREEKSDTCLWKYFPIIEIFILKKD